MALGQFPKLRCLTSYMGRGPCHLTGPLGRFAGVTRYSQRCLPSSKQIYASNDSAIAFSKDVSSPVWSTLDPGIS